MPKSTIELVRNLLVQFRRFTGLCGTLDPVLQGADLIHSVELAYSRLRFNIKRSEDLYFQYTVSRAENGSSLYTECYCDDTQRVEVLQKHFESLAADPVSINGNDTDGVTGPKDLDKYLAIAESIASSAYLCSAGDDYRPGYFSEINITAERIILKQVNHMNSRSIDHKNSYTMRELQFEIPLLKQPETRKTFIGEEGHHIGIMYIRFSDRSSQSKRTCGNGIRKKIEEEKERFVSSASL